ncbi:MAG: LacI family DNA-binding transcriptional regulator [Paenibacillaceae bacterium]|nr:LacI family DNA-binding transcriptional regulator [Paenibacillaceae bacterium]
MSKLTIRDVAQAAGVSTATISRVLNDSGYVSAEVREHVQATIRSLGYRPNAIARSLKQEKSRSIGLIVPDMTNPYFMTVARAVQRRIEREGAGYHLLIMDSAEDPEKEREALHFLLEKRVEAIVLAGTGGNRELVQTASDGGTYVVLADRTIDGLSLDVVAEDNVDVSREAIVYLAGRGHRRIAVINGRQTISTARERYAGVCAGFVQAGLQAEPELVIEGDYTRQGGIAAIRALMIRPERPTAVYCANNEMTFGVYLGLQELGFPLDELDIVSFGDLEFSSLFHQRLTVIRQNPERLGEEVGELVMRRRGEGSGEAAAGREKLVLYPKLERR